MNVQERYDAFLALTKELHALELVDGLLSWDQQTKMPPRGAALRADQMAVLSGIHHVTLTKGAMPDHLKALQDDDTSSLGDDAAVNLREVRRQFDRASRVPTDLVKEIARVQALSMEAWTEAKEASDFNRFAPFLEKTLGLKLQVADAIGYTGSRYNALHDEFEPGSRAEDVAVIFADLRKKLVPLVQAIAESRRAGTQKLMDGHFPVDRQEALGRDLLTSIGFDWEAGRIDVSAHPFCSGNLHDVRLTTRYDAKDLTKSLFGLLHEGGHGLYEQGFDPDHAGTPRAQAVSLGIHESQSLTWENIVGRSRPFWEHAYPVLTRHFPDLAGEYDLDQWHRQVNLVERSMIRVEADEVTYCLHVILRFELEMDLIEGRLTVRDLPEAWNAKMVDFLDLTPKNDAEGVLQDIHWAHAIFGYFPTYALGYLYAAQFWNTARKELPHWEETFRKGDFSPLREWQREKIHLMGQTYPSHELVRRVTGESLNPQYFLDYLRDKYTEIYDL